MSVRQHMVPPAGLGSLSFWEFMCRGEATPIEASQEIDEVHE